MNEYIRTGRLYDPDEIMPWLGDHILLWGGKPVKMNSQRYRVFLGKKKRKCVCCGLKGEYFALEQHKYQHNTNGKFHFNFYGIKNGKEVLMTKDHKIPKSKGGSNKLKNLQTMCEICNGKKGNQMIFKKGGKKQNGRNENNSTKN